MRATALVLLGLAMWCALGCGAPRSRVHGVVRFQGKALTAGTVGLVASDNQTHLAPIGKDGHYEIDGVARGQVKVSIQVPFFRVQPKWQPDKGGPDNSEKAKDDQGVREMPPQGPIVPLPEHYSDANRSGLSFQLTQPDQEYNIDLK
jgi:hypothetical protein